ncbi:hypothetical protein WJ438_28745 [Streptomyces sp. GD-15H]|uniref:hypothetical protein n=1 Tax=Streptomyces sp. GD-15H TaxID=3129112 RepID=UPI003243639C
MTLAFSYVGYRLNDRSPHPPWVIGELVAGVIVTAVLARVGKKEGDPSRVPSPGRPVGRGVSV